MNLITLRYFIAVADYGSYSKAADALFVTQPTLSRQVLSLEDELGVPLFYRNGRAIHLTEAGRICLDEARQIVAHCDALTNNIKKLQQTVRGRLSIAYFCGSDEMSNVITHFAAAYPDIQLQLHSVKANRLCSALEQTDLVFGLQSIALQIPDAVFVPIESIAATIAISKMHPLSQLERASIQQFRDCDFIFYNRNTADFPHDTLMAFCNQNGFVPKIKQYVNDMQSFVYLVAAGLGVGFMASYMSKVLPPDVKLVELEDYKKDLNLGFLYKPRNTTPAISCFINYLSQRNTEST